MALLSINAAVEAGANGEFTDDEILAAAHAGAETLTKALLGPRGKHPRRTPPATGSIRARGG